MPQLASTPIASEDDSLLLSGARPWAAQALALVNASPGWSGHARSQSSRIGLTASSAAWFSELPATHRARVIADTTFEEFAPRSTVSFAPDGTDAWIGVMEGLAVVTRATGHTRAGTSDCVQPGCWVKQSRLLAALHGRGRCWALRRLVLARMPATTFQWLKRASRSFAESICVRFDEPGRGFGSPLALDLGLPADTRVARALVHLVRAQSTPGPQPSVRLAQRELGELCRMPRQRVNKAIARLGWRDCVVTEYGGVRIVDMARLEQAARVD